MGNSRTIISHAQNFEDVILWRALKDVVGGFYIDIGAQDPVIDSVSLAFYKQGWRGVHVEPVPEYAEKLRNARPDEQVIEAIVDARTGRRAFYEIPGTGLSTGSRKIAGRHGKSGFEFRKISVPCLPLSTTLDSRGQRDIHWLKIDVEGMERQVIQSWGDSPARPWVIVVESTQPLLEASAFTQWEPLLLEREYEFVYFDGLNRFYVSSEHRELRERFGPGPNVFDDFVLSGRSSAGFCARLNEEIRAVQHRLGESEANAARLTQVADELRDGAAAERASFVGVAAAWETAIAALTGELAAKTNALAARETQIAALEARIGDLDGQRMRLEGLVLERDREIAVLRAELSARDQAIEAQETRVVELNGTVTLLTERVNETSVEATRLATAKDAIHSEFARYKREQLVAASGWATEKAELSNAIARLRHTIADANAWGQAAMAHQAALENQIEEIRQSTSWRVTAPLRLVRRGVHYGIHGSWAWLTLRPGSRPRRVARHAVVAIIESIRVRPGAFRLAKRLSPLFPDLTSKLRAAVQSERSPQTWRLSLPPSVERAKGSLAPAVRRQAIASADRPDMPAAPPEAASETFAVIHASMQKWSWGRRLHA